MKRAVCVFKIFSPLFLLLIITVGCGYRFAGEESDSFSPLRTFFVEPFINRTSEAYAENVIRGAFAARFVQEGRFRLASSRETADVVCRGTVRSIATSPLSYSAASLAAEERMTLRMEIIFEERATGRIIWKDKALVGTGDYLVTGMTMTERNRKDALLKLARDSAERAYQLMMSDF